MLKRNLALLIVITLLVSIFIPIEYAYATETDITTETEFQIRLGSGFPVSNEKAKQQFEQSGYSMNFSHSINDNAWTGSFHYTDTATPYHIYQAIVSPKNGALDESGEAINRTITGSRFVFSSNVPFYSDMPIFIMGKEIVDGEIVTKLINADIRNNAVYETAPNGTFTLTLTLPECNIYEYNVFFAVGGTENSSPLMEQSTVSRLTYAYEDSSAHTAEHVNQNVPTTGEFSQPEVPAVEETILPSDARTPRSSRTVTVINAVSGAYANTTQEFDFWVLVSPLYGLAIDKFPLPFPFIILNADGTPASSGSYNANHSPTSGFMHFRLSHGQRIIISDFPANEPLFVRVVQKPVSPYTITSVENFGRWDQNNNYSFGEVAGYMVLIGTDNTGSAELKFTNTSDYAPVPTAAPIFDSPFTIMSLLATVLITCYIGYIYYKKKI